MNGVRMISCLVKSGSVLYCCRSLVCVSIWVHLSDSVSSDHDVHHHKHRRILFFCLWGRRRVWVIFYPGCFLIGGAPCYCLCWHSLSVWVILDLIITVGLTNLRTLLDHYHFLCMSDVSLYQVCIKSKIGGRGAKCDKWSGLWGRNA